METDTRQRILEAAAQLFGQMGYSRASTRAIAAAAGVNEVTLFRHFGSKQNLLRAMVEQFNAQGFAATFEDALTGDYRADILQMAQTEISGTLQGLRRLRMMICDLMEVPELRDILLQGARGNYAIMHRYFQRQIDAGIIREGLTAQTLVYGFEGLFSTSTFFRLLFDTELSPDAVPEALIAQLCDVFIEGTIRR